jgi:hypothetical protein
MRQRGISTIGAMLLAAAAAMVVGVFMMDWMIVDVRTPEPENLHIVVPFPLGVADLAAEFVPRHALEEAQIPPEVAEHKDMVIAAVRSLLEAPDHTLVRVDTADEHVLITKEGDDLHVSVDADDAVVRCTVPIDGVVDALEAWDWRTADPDLVFDVLAAAGNGNLLTVEAEGTHVAINMW